MRVKEAPKKFHFLGICGTAMASVAAALQERGFKVTGSDENVYPPMSSFLQEQGIALKAGYRAENIPADADVVVIGNVMRRGNPEVEAVLNRKLFYLSELVIVNNIEFDHADIFSNLDEIKLSFRRLLNIVPQNGMVLLNGDDHNCVEVARDCLGQMIEVGFSKNCAQRIRDVAYSSSGSRFKLGDDVFEIPLVGEFNVCNAAMAAMAARFYDVPKTKIDSAFKSFTGIARLQELRGEARGIKVIDDFGHHPTAIASTLQALRHRFRGKRLWAVFEPRSNTTRRAVFQQQLPEALKIADGVFISQVARLAQIPKDQRLNPERGVAAIAKAG